MCLLKPRGKVRLFFSAADTVSEHRVVRSGHLRRIPAVTEKSRDALGICEIKLLFGSAVGSQRSAVLAPVSRVYYKDGTVVFCRGKERRRGVSRVELRAEKIQGNADGKA